MKLTKDKLAELIYEELELVLEESGFLGNGYKWCKAGTKCSPQKNKTKWWKGA